MTTTVMRPDINKEELISKALTKLEEEFKDDYCYKHLVENEDRHRRLQLFGRGGRSQGPVDRVYNSILNRWKTKGLSKKAQLSVDSAISRFNALFDRLEEFYENSPEDEEEFEKREKNLLDWIERTDLEKEVHRELYHAMVNGIFMRRLAERGLQRWDHENGMELRNNSRGEKCCSCGRRIGYGVEFLHLFRRRSEMSSRSAYCHLSCADNYKIDPKKKTHTATIITWDWRKKNAATRKELKAIVSKHKCHVTRANPTHIFFVGNGSAQEPVPVHLEKALRKKSCCMPPWLLKKEKRLRKEAAIRQAKRNKDWHYEDVKHELHDGTKGEIQVRYSTREYDGKLGSMDFRWYEREPERSQSEKIFVFHQKWVDTDRFRLEELAKGNVPASVVVKMVETIKEYQKKFDKKGFKIKV